MIIVEQNSNTFSIVLNPSEVEALEREVSNPPDWLVKDIATFLHWTLSAEVDRAKLRYNL